MKNGLYRIEVRAQLEELENGGHVMIMGDGGMVFAEIHPIKIKGTPKKEKPIVGLDGTVYTQDEDKQGWTGYTPVKVDPLDAVRFLRDFCKPIQNCVPDCPLFDWCDRFPAHLAPAHWMIPEKED